MHVYTFVQIIGLAVLYIVSYFKSIALAFPFFVLLMLPLRLSLNRLPKFSMAKKKFVGTVYNDAELEAVSIRYLPNFFCFSCNGNPRMVGHQEST